MEKKLVDHLVKSGVVGSKDIQRCVLRASMTESSVVDEMINRLGIDQEVLAEAMAQFWGLSCWQKGAIGAEAQALRLIPPDLAKDFGVLPVVSDPDDDAITLAVYDVQKARPVIEKIRDKTGIAPTLVLTTRDAIEREVRRHYGLSQTLDGTLEAEVSANTPSAPARGVVRPRRKSKAKAIRPAAMATADDDAVPTRQIDLTTDNPFMDLVQSTAAPSASKKADPAPPEAPNAPSDVEEVVEEEVDFFEGFDDFDSEPALAAESSVSSQNGKPNDGILGALDAFDAELDDGGEVEESSYSSSVDWGAARSEAPFSRSGSSGSGFAPLGQSDSSGSQDLGGSAIFPLEDPTMGIFTGGRGGADGPSLADIVDEQSRRIEKLQREVEYQKGILQTMADLLIESRVISRRKLKSRLKAFKEEQKKTR